MTSEDSLPFLPGRQPVHSESDHIQAGVVLVGIKWPMAEYEPFLRLGVAHNPHRHLEACETFEELSPVGGDIPVFICSSLKWYSYLMRIRCYSIHAH